MQGNCKTFEDRVIIIQRLSAWQRLTGTISSFKEHAVKTQMGSGLLPAPSPYFAAPGKYIFLFIKHF